MIRNISCRSRVFLAAAAVSIVLFFNAGCRPQSSPAPKPSTPPVQPGTTIMGPGEHTVDIGDAEANVRIEMAIPEESRTGQVSVDDEKTVRGALSMSTANVKPPFPEQLWLKIRMVPGGDFDFGKRPILVRGTIFRDKQPVDTFSTILGKHIRTRGTILAGEVPPLEFKLNALEGLSGFPQTMLLHAEARLEILPEGTDETAAVSSAPPENEKNSTTILSNPVRINFAAEGNGV